MGRKWNNIKEKRPKKIKIQVEYMRNLVKKYIAAKSGEPDPESNKH